MFKSFLVRQGLTLGVGVTKKPTNVLSDGGMNIKQMFIRTIILK